MRIPVLWLDVKGANFAPGEAVADPLEAAAIITDGLHSSDKPYFRADYLVKYPTEDAFREVKRKAHFSCLENELLDDVERRGFNEDAYEPKQQIINWLADEVLYYFQDQREVWVPIWNFAYEREIFEAAREQSPHLDGAKTRFRVLEMRDVSAFAVAVKGLGYPERSNWRSLESLDWYIERSQQIFGYDEKPVLRVSEPD